MLLSPRWILFSAFSVAPHSNTCAGPSPQLVKDFNGTSASSSIFFLTVVGDSLFLAANGKIWKTDGTTAGTFLVRELNLRLLPSNPRDFVDLNGTAFVLTIDGRRFEFDKPPYKVDFDTSYARYRVITLRAEALGKDDDQNDAVLASFYTNVIAENGQCDKTKPLLLFAGVLEAFLAGVIFFPP